MTQCVITSAVRTAVGAYLGSLKTVEEFDLLAPVLCEAVRRAKIEKKDVEQVIMGNCINKTPNIARVASLVAGFEDSVPGYTVDRQCGSSLQAVVNAAQDIAAGDSNIVLAGGVENMSRAPYYMPAYIRYQGCRINKFQVEDAFEYGSAHAHPEALFPNLNMGITAENVAAKHKITREAQDAFAAESHSKAVGARAAGKFKDEILPFEVKQKKTSFIFDQDEHMKEGTTAAGLAALRPVFKAGGTVTAGNASGMNDGASAVTVMSADAAREKGVKPLVKIVSYATAGVDPAVMGLGPVPAARLALKKANLALDDIDLFEFNEAFAAQTLGCLIELGLAPGSKGYERVNVNGGAVAHGHALGNSGTRILTTLIYEMKRRNAHFGLATMCIGGGQGIAVIVENV